jgi:hypothetical protein
MGIYTVRCPRCYAVHSWFSGSSSQLCYQCQWGAVNWQNELQIKPREAVVGDIGDWAECEAVKFANAAEWPPHVRMTFGEWVKNVRTVKLMELNKRLEKRLGEVTVLADARQYRLNVLQDHFNSRYDESKATEMQAEIDALKLSEKVNSDFIKLQARQLISARNHLLRVRYHCDLPEVGE